MRHTFSTPAVWAKSESPLGEATSGSGLRGDETLDSADGTTGRPEETAPMLVTGMPMIRSRYEDSRMRRNSALNVGTTSAAIAEEQEFLDQATVRRDKLADHLRAELSAEALDALERARLRILRQQYEE